MAKIGYYKRYLYIINKLKSNTSNFEDLQRYIVKKLENDFRGDKNKENSIINYSIRTFDRDKKDIQDLFGILIEYDRNSKTYYIEDDEENPSTSRMIEAFSIHQALRDVNMISSFVFLEKRKPKGVHLMNDLIYATQNNFQITFTYTKFCNIDTTQRILNPVAIKESQHRWYLIGEDQKDKCLKSFGFDRIFNLKITNLKFKPINYNVDNAHKHSFGIENYANAEVVILEFSWEQGNYIKSFPLHSSQKIIEDTQEKLVIELFIHPTNDFIMEMLKYGKNLKILHPFFLIDEIKNRLTDTMNVYEI